MMKLILLLVIAYGSYELWHRYGQSEMMTEQKVSVAPLFSEPYVAVYGRDSCGYTQKLLQELKASRVDHHYFVVDEKPIADRLHATMIDQGLDVRRYNLPVVDVSGDLSIRPSITDVKIKL